MALLLFPRKLRLTACDRYVLFIRSNLISQLR